VISVAPDRPATTERAVDGARDADSEAAEAAAEGPRVVGFDDEMEMVVLNRKLKNPKPRVGGDGQGAADGREDPCGSEAADALAAPEGDVHRVRRDVCRARAMRDAGAAARGELAAGAGATPPQVRGEGRDNCKVRAILTGL